ncbi:hypothetical protein [Nonomuraea rosea]|uniref:hypothetical protein n=1 Tax=Nonomuraea rosea TaxID=638574 RepID=UPI0031E8A9DD
MNRPPWPTPSPAIHSHVTAPGATARPRKPAAISRVVIASPVRLSRPSPSSAGTASMATTWTEIIAVSRTPTATVPMPPLSCNSGERHRGWLTTAD